MKYNLPFSAVTVLFLIEAVASQDITCDPATQEQCYDENFSPVSCANVSDGGCPCPDGEVKCGAFQGYAGWCTPLCCDFVTEETCYNETTVEPMYCAKISNGGCPCRSNQVRCGVSQYSIGYCTDTCCETDVCCDSVTEETCIDEDSNPSSCAPIEEGCPCPEGESRCGAFEGFPGVCTTLCCDTSTEETCYGENWEPLYCAKRASGGCPCPGSQVRCGASALDPGYCTDVCCDLLTEEACYESTAMDQSTPSYCAKISDGGCPCPNSDEVKCGASEYYAGYCTRVCCDWRYEQPCYDDNNVLVGCAFAGGQCPNYDVSESSGVPSPAPVIPRMERPTSNSDSTDIFRRKEVPKNYQGPMPTPSHSVPYIFDAKEKRKGMHPTLSHVVTMDAKTPSISPLKAFRGGIRPSSSYDVTEEVEVEIS